MTNEIETERLTLRPYRDADIEAITRLINDPRVYRNVGNIPPRRTEAETRRIQTDRANRNRSGKSAGFAIYLGQDLIGMVGGGENETTGILDFGYWVAPEHWGNGYATEAARGYISWVTAAQGRRELTAGYFPDNPSSGRVLDKLGFQKVSEGTYFCLGRNETVACINMHWAVPNDEGET